MNDNACEKKMHSHSHSRSCTFYRRRFDTLVLRFEYAQKHQAQKVRKRKSSAINQSFRIPFIASVERKIRVGLQRAHLYTHNRRCGVKLDLTDSSTSVTCVSVEGLKGREEADLRSLKSVSVSFKSVQSV